MLQLTHGIPGDVAARIKAERDTLQQARLQQLQQQVKICISVVRHVDGGVLVTLSQVGFGLSPLSRPHLLVSFAVTGIVTGS
jgi:hypothetical protein